MLKRYLALSCAVLLGACNPNSSDPQWVMKEFKHYHAKKDVHGLLEVLNGRTLYPPYQKALKKVLTEEVNYPIKSISIHTIEYKIPKDIYNIQPTHELVVEYATDYQLSSVYLLGHLDGKPTLAWICPPELENSVAPRVENTQSRENLYYEN